MTLAEPLCPVPDIAPMTSPADMDAAIASVAPLVTQRFDAASRLRELNLPLVVVHGSEDQRQQLRDKETLLLELQHRVKNNLQIITALVRMEARSLPDGESGERFDRLAGRIGALALLYQSLSGEDMGETVDLGTYLSGIVSSVMAAHAVPGIRVETRVDTWPSPRLLSPRKDTPVPILARR